MSLSLDDKNSQREDRQKERFAAFAQMFGEGRSFSGHERNCCYLNTGGSPSADGRFANISAASGIDFPDDARALALVDWDQDGDLDVWVANRNAPRLRLLRNEIPLKGHFLNLRLVGNGTTTSRDAIGARVEVVPAEPVPGTPRSIKTLRAGEGFLAQNSKWLHFGLGTTSGENTPTVNKVLVHWPGGEVEEYRDLAIDQHHVLTQGSGAIHTLAIPARDLALSPSDQPTATATTQFTLRLLHPVKMPPLPFQTWAGETLPIAIGNNQPVLVSFFASWCKPCLDELAEFTHAQDRLRSAGLTIIALSVDGVGKDTTDPADSQKLLTSLAFPFDSGRATEDLLEGIQKLHDRQVTGKKTLPLPTSFLVNAEGQLAAIYKGSVDVETLLRDVQSPANTGLDRYADTAFLPGRVVKHATALETFRRANAEQRFKTADLFLDYDLRDEAIDQYNAILDLWPEANSASVPSNSTPDEALASTSLLPRQREKRRHIRSMAYSSRGLAREQAGELDTALEDYQQAIALNPENGQLYSNLAIVYLKLRKPNLAIKDFTRAIEHTADPAHLYLQRGNVHQRMKQHTLAIADYGEAIQRSPELASAYKRRGDSYRYRRKNPLAVADYTRALEIEPDDPSTLSERGKTFVRLGDAQAALADFSKVVQLNPKDAETYNNRGMTYESLGKFQEARDDYARSIEIHATNPAAYNNLGWLLATCHEAEFRNGGEALAHAKKVCELLDWKSVEALDTLAAAYAESGDFKEAVRWQTKAIELAPQGGNASLRSRLDLYQNSTPYRRTPSS